MLGVNERMGLKLFVEKYAQITLYRANQNHTARRKAHYDKLTAYAYTKRRFPTVLGDIAPPIYAGIPPREVTRTSTSGIGT